MLLETLQNTAEIAGIEPEVADEIAGGQDVALRQFIEDSAFGE